MKARCPACMHPPSLVQLFLKGKTGFQCDKCEISLRAVPPSRVLGVFIPVICIVILFAPGLPRVYGLLLIGAILLGSFVYEKENMAIVERNDATNLSY